MKRWVASRKTSLCLDVREGRITLADAEKLHGVSAEEIAGWDRKLDAHGTRGLHATRTQIVREPAGGAPIRLQLSRRKGFDLQAGSHAVNGLLAVNCARPSLYGNPYIIGLLPCDCRSACRCGVNSARSMNAAEAVAAFRKWRRDIRKARPAKHEAYIAPLRGRNLACWCAIDAEHCHVDILLTLAREPELGK